jgi:hypothetical protein
MSSWTYGSQHQLRRWIVERPDEVSRELTSRNDRLGAWAQRIEWLLPANRGQLSTIVRIPQLRSLTLWPTAESGAERRDEAWRIIGLDGDSPVQAGWWPKGGAVWDAGARVHGPDGQVGGILVEAKGRERKLSSSGCKASDQQSIETIRSALADVQNELGLAPSPEWMGPCYQPANRLAVLWYARVKCEPPVPLWLVSLYVCGEHYPTATGELIGPATEQVWEPVIGDIHRRMGLPPHPHMLTAWWIEAFLPALEPPGGWPRPRGPR